jgi:hypothetical protein
VANYRIFALNHAGRIAGSEDVDCRSDEAAFAYAAAALAPGARAEIWQGMRCLGKVSDTSQALNQSNETSPTSTG